MYKEALDKIDKSLELFKRLVAPLKYFSGISFGYMKIFEDGYYYKILENKECLNEFVLTIDQSCIFCERNVTDYLDGGYCFTLWPKTPLSPAMEVYFKHNIWDGITISKTIGNCTELYWFAGNSSDTNYQKFFLKNKSILLEFIQYFDSNKKQLFNPFINSRKSLFKFKNGFITDLPKSERMKDSHAVQSFLSSLCERTLYQEDKNGFSVKLSLRELEILAAISNGLTSKGTARKLQISIKTVQHHVENIKQKTGLHFKSDLVAFYEQNFRSVMSLLYAAR